MKANILILGLQKSFTTKLKRELIKCTTKNSFEFFTFENSKKANQKIKDDEYPIIIWMDSTENKDYKHFRILRNKFPESIIILISSGNINTIIEETNLYGLFRITKNNPHISELLKYLEQAIHHWQVLQNDKKKMIGNDKETILKELLIAQEIQKNLLKTDSPKWKNIDIACFSESAKNVGGDFYSYYGMQNDRALISKHLVAVGDVSGKGISAALLMATCLSHIDNSMKLNFKLSERMAYLDSLIVPFTQPQKQNCALCMIELVGVNTNQAFAKVVNAACIPPYIKRKDGSVEWISARGFALGQGIGKKLGYKESRINLQKGDMIILVSDGIIEANNDKNELLGFDNFFKIIQSATNTTSKDMLNYINKQIQIFTNGYEQHDDMTIVVIRYH